MGQSDPKSVLDDLLSRWHTWAKGYSINPAPGADPMFRQARSSKQWDSSDDILDTEINSKIMEAIDFQVSEMVDPHKTAIHINARNCASGANVWNSPRLPADPLERSVIVLEARNTLTRKLISCGVI